MQRGGNDPISSRRDHKDHLLQPLYRGGNGLRGIKGLVPQVAQSQRPLCNAITRCPRIPARAALTEGGRKPRAGSPGSRIRDSRARSSPRRARCPARLALPSTSTCGANHSGPRPGSTCRRRAGSRPGTGRWGEASGAARARGGHWPRQPGPPRATSPQNAEAPGARGRPEAENLGALVPGGRVAWLPPLKPPPLPLNCLQTPS